MIFKIIFLYFLSNVSGIERDYTHDKSFNQIYNVLTDNSIKLNPIIQNYIPFPIKTLSKNNSNTSEIEPNPLLVKLLEFLYTNTNDEVIKEFLYGTCYTSITKVVNDTDRDRLIELINSSGKSMNDLGIQGDCENKNNTYFFLNIDIDENNFLKNTDYNSILKFTNQKHFFIGFCSINECSSFFQSFFNTSKNSKFFSMLQPDGITNVTIYGLNANKSTRNEEKFSTGFKIFGIFLLSYVSIKILISIFGSLYLFVSEKENPSNFNDSDESEFISEDSEINSKTVVISPSNKTDAKIKKKENSCKTFYKILSFRASFKYLFRIKNKFYDETNLQVLSGIRFVLLFWFIYNHNYFSLSLLPNRYMGNYKFFQSFWFIFIKFSIFASDMIIFIDGLIFSFKLFSFLKENKATFTNFMIFFGNFMTRIVCFYIIFFILHISINDIGILIGKGSFFQFIYEKRISSRNCYQDPWLSIIPFAIQYGCQNNNFDYRCYKFFYLYTTELYCLLILMIIFFIANKVKSNKFDLIVTSLIILSGTLAFLNYDMTGRYDINSVLGESKSLQRIELMIFPYFLGVLGGIIYFYYCDIICEKPVEYEDYIPFKFCRVLMEKFDKLNDSKLRYLFIAISLTIQILLCLSFSIYLFFYDNPDKKLDFTFNYYFTFLYIYEKKFFIMAFFVNLIMVLVSYKENILKDIFNSGWFLLISRIGFVFLSTSDSITYLFYAIYDIQVNMNFNNLFLISIGLFCINFILALFLVILFEIPFRVIYKKITQNLIQKKRKKVFDKIAE